MSVVPWSAAHYGQATVKSRQSKSVGSAQPSFSIEIMAKSVWSTRRSRERHHTGERRRDADP